MSNQRRPFSRRLSAAAVAMGLGVLLLVGPLAPPASAATPAPLLDATFTTLLNTLRGTLGLGSLAVDPQLSGVARDWSTHMANTGVMAHNPALTSQAQGWAKLGENVGNGGAVTQIFNALVASPPHMRNMSNPDFSRVGIATVTDAHSRLWTTHVFMQPKAAGASAPARPAAAAAPASPAPAAPAATKAPKPVPTTAAPAPAAAPAAPPPAPVPAPVTLPTTTAAPVDVSTAGMASATEATHFDGPVALTRAGAPSGSGVPGPLLVGAALLILLVVGAAGFTARGRPGRAASSRDAGPSAPDGNARHGAGLAAG